LIKNLWPIRIKDIRVYEEPTGRTLIRIEWPNK